jgi:hypothetical protein
MRETSSNQRRRQNSRSRISHPQITWLSRSGCQCKKEDFKSSTEAAQHLDNHLCKDIEVPGVRCCRLAPCNKRIDAVDFDSLTAWHAHTISVHRLAFQWVKPKKGEEEVGTSKFYVDWCGFCGKWLCQLTEDFEQHVAMHEQLVGQLIEQDGYAGVEMGDKMIQPAINPFSGPDTSVTCWDRFKTHFDSQDMFEVITKIIDSMERMTAADALHLRGWRVHQSYLQRADRAGEGGTSCSHGKRAWDPGVQTSSPKEKREDQSQ